MTYNLQLIKILQREGPVTF